MLQTATHFCIQNPREVCTSKSRIIGKLIALINSLNVLTSPTYRQHTRRWKASAEGDIIPENLKICQRTTPPLTWTIQQISTTAYGAAWSREFKSVTKFRQQKHRVNEIFEECKKIGCWKSTRTRARARFRQTLSGTKSETLKENKQPCRKN